MKTPLNWLLSVCLWLLVIPTSSASMYRIPPWEVVIDEADFVGLVECETEGPIVSRYRVLEVWKGDPKQEYIVVRDLISPHYGQMGAHLCGKASLMTLRKTDRSKTTLYSNSETSLQSQRWKISSDYDCGMFDTHPLKSEKSGSFAFIEQTSLSSKNSLQEIKSRSIKFLLLPEEQRLIQRVYSSIENSIERESRSDDKESKRAVSLMKHVVAKLKQTKTIKEAVDIFITNPEVLDHSGVALIDGGERITTLLEEKRNELKEQYYIALDEVRIYHLGMSTRKSETNALQSLSTAAELNKAERDWLNVPLNKFSILNESRSIPLLTKNRPESIVERLLIYQHPENTHRSVCELASYELIRYFGSECAINRKQHLEKLLEAKDSIIRTGAAVYLCSEDLEKGMNALEQCAKLQGIAGTWAAITLASRGKKEAVPRALQVFDFKQAPDLLELQSGWDKQGQLLALFSNSAKASGVPQPTAPYDVWWQKYGDKITLHDPWLAEMDRLKID